MPRTGFGSIVVGTVMVLGLATASQAEDSLGFAIGCRGGCGVGTQVSSDTLLAAVPGRTFVITVAYLAPSPEDAFVRGRPVKCRPAEFRVDTHRIVGRDGSVAVEIGEKLELAAGKSARIVLDVDPNTPRTNLDMDQLAFRLRAARTQPCDLVAGGMAYEADDSPPTPFSLLVDDGRKGLPRHHRH